MSIALRCHTCHLIHIWLLTIDVLSIENILAALAVLANGAQELGQSIANIQRLINVLTKRASRKSKSSENSVFGSPEGRGECWLIKILSWPPFLAGYKPLSCCFRIRHWWRPLISRFVTYDVGHNADTWGTFKLGFFEVYYKTTGNSAKLDQRNPRFVVGIFLGQTPAIGGGGRYDRAACRDVKQSW